MICMDRVYYAINDHKSTRITCCEHHPKAINVICYMASPKELQADDNYFYLTMLRQHIDCYKIITKQTVPKTSKLFVNCSQSTLWIDQILTFKHTQFIQYTLLSRTNTY